MLTKIIDLGYEVPETGEPRVRLIQPNLVKTASTEIQDFWDSMEPDDNNSYLWVIGVSAKEFYGCNNNGDAFTEEDLKKTHSGFVSNAHVFLQHVNKDPAKSIGKPVYSWYNDVMHRVELILKIDKKNPNAAATVVKIQNGDPIYVSMGTVVSHDICSICGHKSATRREYCDHLRYNLKKILPDGRQVYALNPNPKFFDISIVAKPADPTAFTLDKRASLGRNTDMATLSSAELGDLSNDLATKVASLKKLSDIVKQVDGQVVDAKDNKGTATSTDASADNDEAKKIQVVRIIRDSGFENLDYPEMPYDSFPAMHLSPAGLLSCLTSLGSPITLGDAAWMAGNHVYGHCPRYSEYHDMFSLLPSVLRHLIDHPEPMGGIVRNIFSSYGGELDTPVQRTIIIRIIKPVAQARIRIVRSISTPEELEKVGIALGHPSEDLEQYGHSDAARFFNDFRSRKENFATIRLRDEYGNEAVTTPYHMRQAFFQRPSNFLTNKAVMAALALGAIGAVLSQPDLMRKALAATAFSIPAVAMANAFKYNNESSQNITTSEGDVLPNEMAAAIWKYQKTAAEVTPPKPKIRTGTLVGMAIPGALALDYAYNRWKYGPYGNPEGDGLLTRMGEFVAEHPAITALGGGIVGSQMGRAGGALWKHIAGGK